MDYNNNTYITILHSDCELLGLQGENKTNTDKTICILEYTQNETIPNNILDKIINTYNHQEAIQIVNSLEWVNVSPYNPVINKVI
jgi:GTP-sensing pleiotropic transcriptional regulator CodY